MGAIVRSSIRTIREEGVAFSQEAHRREKTNPGTVIVPHPGEGDPAPRVEGGSHPREDKDPDHPAETITGER